METPSGVPIVSTGKAEPNPDDVEQAIKARLPLFNNPRKAEYLSMRACGFSIREAAALAHVNQGTVGQWRKSDPDFASWESGELNYLQTNLVQIVAEAKWMRNFALVMILDGKVLQKAAFNRHGLTEFEQGYAKSASKRYDGQGAIAIQRAFGDAKADGDGDTINVDKAIIIVDGREVTSEEARRVAARKLLQQHTQTSKYLPEHQTEVIEGELVDGDGD